MRINKPGRSYQYLIFTFALVGFLLSVSQIFGESPDYSQYEDYFDLVRRERNEIFEVTRFEPGFSIVSVLISFVISSNIIVYSTFVAFIMLMKGWVIDVYALTKKTFIVASIYYFVRYFPIHDLTQLRAACAIALMLVGTVYLWRGEFLLGASICLIALTFHYSSAAIIPALLVKVNRRWLVVLIALLVFVVTQAFTELVTGYFANFLIMLDSYQNNGFGEDKPNPYAFQLLIDWFFIIVSLIFWGKNSIVMKRVVFLQLIGMSIFYGGIEFAIIAHRVREFYSVFWLLYIVDGVQRRETQIITYAFICISLTYYSYIFFLSGEFFH